MKQYLKPTLIIDSDNMAIQEKAQELTQRQEEPAGRAKSLFYFVRDEIKYNAYLPRYLTEHFRASNTLARKEGFCIQKAVLLVALSRAVGIPGRLGFAVLRNHLLPKKLAAMLAIKVIPDHGYAELYLNGKWVRATPAFDLEMCQENQIIPVEFDGKSDGKFHSHTVDGRLHIEYLSDHGHYGDVPLGRIWQWDAGVLKPDAKTKILGNGSVQKGQT